MALVAAALVLGTMAWFDTRVMSAAQQRAASLFDSSSVAIAWAVGSLAIAGAVLLLAVLVWRAKTGWVGVVYAVAGGFFVLLPWTTFTLAAHVNDALSVLPEPLAIAVSRLLLESTGPLNAVTIVGAGMVIAGIAVIAQQWRERATTSDTAPTTARRGVPLRP
jgi:hypothetical protein